MLGCDVEFKLLLYFAGYNVALSFIHFILWKIKDRTSTDVDNKLHDIVDWLLTINNWIMANRRNPISREEVQQAVNHGLSENKDP